ncbi:uncharacterized protein [Mobula birostris]|uniref:uncharacterized protein n=1 Tax=Mobula birostris TaxID=1983395 RepID=UPI003B289C01
MENKAFELSEDIVENSQKTAKKEIYQQDKVKRFSLMKFFLVCLLASVITTTVGVLVLALIYVIPQLHPQQSAQPSSSPSTSSIDVKYKYLYHLDKSEVLEYPGGAIQWGRFRKNPTEYENKFSMEFGKNINEMKSKMTVGTLRVEKDGLRVPHWHFNANEHGYLLTGKAWIGVIDDGTNVVATYNVTAGQVIFFPKNTLHWVKSVGEEECIFLLFFTTHDELSTLDMDDAFFSTPEDIASRSLKPVGGVKFIRSLPKQKEDQAINFPPNLKELVTNESYIQSEDSIVWKYFYDLPGSKNYTYSGGIIQWARYLRNTMSLTENEKVFANSLHQHADTLTLATLRIYSNGLRQPHFHFNAHEMGYVISGCGQVGVIGSSTTDFQIDKGDVFFFPIGTQHYIKSTCVEDLLLILAFSTGDQLETLDMDDYFHATADQVLAQLFFKPQNEFKKILMFEDDQAVNRP